MRNTEILTERLLLKPFHLENLSEIHEKFCRANSEFLINERNPCSLEEERDFLICEIEKHRVGKSLNNFVYRRSDEAFMGVACISEANGSSPELGWWLAPEFQRQDYGCEMYQATLDWLRLHRTDVRKAIHRSLVRNERSIALAYKFGWVEMLREMLPNWEVEVIFDIPM